MARIVEICEEVIKAHKKLYGESDGTILVGFKWGNELGLKAGGRMEIMGIPVYLDPYCPRVAIFKFSKGCDFEIKE